MAAPSVHPLPSAPTLAERLGRARDPAEACRAVVEHLYAPDERLPSVYLARDGRLRCQASLGYWQVLDGFSPSVGVIGRTYRCGEATIVADVAGSEVYVEAAPGIVAEACVPVRLDGRVVGALNVESRRPLVPGLLGTLEGCALLLGARLHDLGALGEASPAQRLARHAVALTELVEAGDLVRATAAAALDVSGLDSVLVATRDERETFVVRHAAGPLAGVLAAMGPDGLADVASWVAAGTSCWSVGEVGGSGFAGAALLRHAGAATAVALPLAGRGRRFGVLVLAHTSAVALPSESIELLELLAGLASSCLQTAEAVALLRRQATRDPLTGLGNQAAFASLLDHELGARQPRPVAVLVVDLDGFKAVNDDHGHPAGDEVLCEAAEVLAGALRVEDRLFRIGGDEFAAVVTVSSAEEALEIAERLRAAARDEARVTVSVGGAVARPGESSTELVARADAALYAVKRGGRDGARLAAPA